VPSILPNNKVATCRTCPSRLYRPPELVYSVALSRSFLFLTHCGHRHANKSEGLTLSGPFPWISQYLYIGPFLHQSFMLLRASSGLFSIHGLKNSLHFSQYTSAFRMQSPATPSAPFRQGKWAGLLSRLFGVRRSICVACICTPICKSHVPAER
jgi:hypothetical protein